MITVSLTQLRTNLSELLNQVEGGQDVIVTRRGKPVARLSGAASSKPLPLRELAEFRATLPPLQRPSVEVLREVRDEQR